MMTVTRSPNPEEPIPIITRDNESCSRDWLKPLNEVWSIASLAIGIVMGTLPQE